MIAQLWFYKGAGNLFDKLIRWFTSGIYSHVEIVIGGMAISADAWSGCVRCTPVAAFHKDNWDIVDVVLTKDMNFLNSQLSKKYDWLGIMGFFLPGAVNDPKRWYCSELGAAALSISKRPISPQKLYEILT